MLVSGSGCIFLYKELKLGFLCDSRGRRTSSVVFRVSLYFDFMIIMLGTLPYINKQVVYTGMVVTL